MSFDYDKYKHKNHTGGDWWASYADLFTMMSFIFLLMYVYAAVTSGTNNIQQQMEFQKLTQEAEDLRQQIKVYNTLKEEYVQNEATEQEQQAYKELMGKLDLLQDQAKAEKDELREKANENEKTERALNKYQQMIRNIINTNMLAKTRLERREKIIAEKEVELTQKGQEISTLESHLEEKMKEVEANNQKIVRLEESLEKKIRELKSSYKAQKISKTVMEKKIAALTQETQSKVSDLERQKNEVSQKLYGVSKELEKTATQLSEKEMTASRYEKQIADMKANRDAELAQERAEFDKKLAAERMSSEAKANALREFNKKAQARAKELDDKIASLQGEVATSNKELEKARRNANARKELANAIKQGFAKAGVEADVDEKTGDVTLSFGDSYFDTGKSKLKVAMKDSLQKFMPSYSEGLFANQNIAEKIKSVEIVGFASPTFKGKYVDPESLELKDRNAVNYNLDLSYQRAKSIFEYIFDPEKMTYKYQKKLLPLVKVTGRSFLAEGAKGRGVAGGFDVNEYCKKFDCKKSQKVIIKFNLDE
ncbi:MAG: hypothetical protein A4S09_11115 [Proteobacteria bacterium SG_bin7]|nr:MAG: hypothetical protein A4S09_11115 [Proteobacteria bacterium SG_bin7]